MWFSHANSKWSQEESFTRYDHRTFKSCMARLKTDSLQSIVFSVHTMTSSCCALCWIRCSSSKHVTTILKWRACVIWNESCCCSLQSSSANVSSSNEWMNYVKNKTEHSMTSRKLRHVKFVMRITNRDFTRLFLYKISGRWIVNWHEWIVDLHGCMKYGEIYCILHQQRLANSMFSMLTCQTSSQRHRTEE